MEQLLLDIEENRCKYPFFYCMRGVTNIIYPSEELFTEEHPESLLGVCLPHAAELTKSHLYQSYPIRFVLDMAKERNEDAR